MFTHLPNEIIFQISDYLEASQLKMMSQVNRKLYQCFTDDYLWQKRLTQIKSSQIEKRIWLCLLERNPFQLQAELAERQLDSKNSAYKNCLISLRQQKIDFFQELIIEILQGEAPTEYYRLYLTQIVDEVLSKEDEDYLDILVKQVENSIRKKTRTNQDCTIEATICQYLNFSFDDSFLRTYGYISPLKEGLICRLLSFHRYLLNFSPGEYIYLQDSPYRYLLPPHRELPDKIKLPSKLLQSYREGEQISYTKYPSPYYYAVVAEAYLKEHRLVCFTSELFVPTYNYLNRLSPIRAREFYFQQVAFYQVNTNETLFTNSCYVAKDAAERGINVYLLLATLLDEIAVELDGAVMKENQIDFFLSTQTYSRKKHHRSSDYVKIKNYRYIKLN